MHALMRARPFATLVSAGTAGLYASHLPTVLKDDGPCGVIECHLARANPHCRDLAEGGEALMIFQGPEGYITPNWYPSKAVHEKVVPTWNYAVVHATGRPEVMTVDRIPAQVLDRMFEPFFSTKEPGRGSGMGLSLAHGIVHEHGGHILVDSMLNERTKFRVLLPVLLSHERGA